MRREARRDEARRAARRAGMQAARAAVRRAGHQNAAAFASDRHPFVCAFACADCKTLAWPKDAAPAGDPMRMDRSPADRPTHDCPHCGAVNWVDLSIPSHAEAILGDLDTHERRKQFARARMRLFAIVSALYVPFALSWCRVTEECVAGLVHGTLPARCNVEVNWGIVALGGLLATFLLASVGRYLVALIAPSPLSHGGSAGQGRALFSGTVEGTDALRSPLTGQPCVAYQVEVRREGSPTRWLVAGRCKGASVGGVELPDDALVDLASAPRAASTADPADGGLARWLTERGIDPRMGSWQLTEATLRTGQLATVRRCGESLVLATARL